MGCGARHRRPRRPGADRDHRGARLQHRDQGNALRAAQSRASASRRHCGRVLWPRLLEVGSSNTPDFAALLERAGGDAGGGIDASYLKTIDADVPRTDIDEDAFRDADGAGAARAAALLLAHCARDGGDGYFQGMNDLAAVVLHAVNATAGDDAAVAAAFGVFEGVLADTRANWARRPRGRARAGAAGAAGAAGGGPETGEEARGDRRDARRRRQGPAVALPRCRQRAGRGRAAASSRARAACRRRGRTAGRGRGATSGCRASCT